MRLPLLLLPQPLMRLDVAVACLHQFKTWYYTPASTAA